MPDTLCSASNAITAPAPASGLSDDKLEAESASRITALANTGLLHRLYLIGCRICDFIANLAGHPASIIVLIVACLMWLGVTGSAGQNLLTLMLSILAITLTQMVLNQQRRSELALHLKIDELITALDGARNELAGIETADEDTLLAARRQVADADAAER